LHIYKNNSVVHCSNSVKQFLISDEGDVSEKVLRRTVGPSKAILFQRICVLFRDITWVPLTYVPLKN